MVSRHRCVLVALIALGASAGRETALAQIPERFTNLQVLPRDISPDSLVLIMGGFTRALGVRCTHCHMAQDGIRPTVDEFAADGREAKQVARMMLRMVAAINTQYLSVAQPHVLSTRVSCATCHRGVTRPVPLEDDLFAVYELNGLDSTIARYRELRARYFGSGAYDFTDITLPTLADRLAAAPSRRQDAVRVMRLNLEYHADSWFTYQQLGQLHAVMGDTTAAITALERGLALNPQRAFMRDLLNRLRRR